MKSQWDQWVFGMCAEIVPPVRAREIAGIQRSISEVIQASKVPLLCHAMNKSFILTADFQKQQIYRNHEAVPKSSGTYRKLIKHGESQNELNYRFVAESDQVFVMEKQDWCTKNGGRDNTNFMSTSHQPSQRGPIMWQRQHNSYLSVYHVTDDELWKSVCM